MAIAVPATGAAPVRSFPKWLPFEWIVAVRFLREGRMQTAFILTGVAVGVGVIIFMSALLSGLQANFVRRVLTGQPHIQLIPPKEVARPLRQGGDNDQGSGNAIVGSIVQAPMQRLKGIDQWQSVVDVVRALPEVIDVSAGLTGSALAVRGDASRAISIVGMEPQQYYRIVTLPEKIVAGTAQIASTDILIGTELASDLGVVVGDKLRITSATGGDLVLTIAGIFDLGNKGANLRNAYVALRTAQSLLALPGGVTVLDVTVHDVYAAEDVAQRISARTGVQADSWIHTNEQFFTAVHAQTTANTAIRFFVALSVALGIASVLVVSVVQKSREIGILRAMGISRGQILRVFLLQGGLLAIGGSVVGCLIGAASLVVWQQVARNPDGTPLFPLVLDPKMFAAALVVAGLTGLAAAYAPALRAARMDPGVAIRG
jgi:lipoprotein-releasing system permease protein